MKNHTGKYSFLDKTVVAMLIIGILLMLYIYFIPYHGFLIEAGTNPFICVSPMDEFWQYMGVFAIIFGMLLALKYYKTEKENKNIR